MQMPDKVKEKLVELLAESEYMSFEKKADHLISNGVTVVDKFATTEQQWISVKDRLPEYGKRVLTFGSRDGQLYVYIDQICGDGGWLFATWEITHWMPLPQPPKGE